MKVHYAAHANIEGGSSQQAHVILADHKKCDRAKSANINSKLWQQEHQESGAQQFGGRDKQYGHVHGTARLDENTVEPDDDCRFQVGQLRGCCGKQPGFVGDRRQVCTTRFHKQGAAPSPTNKRPSNLPLSDHGQRKPIDATGVKKNKIDRSHEQDQQNNRFPRNNERSSWHGSYACPRHVCHGQEEETKAMIRQGTL